MGVAHWDEVESHRRAKGEMDATWQRLGDAAGTAGRRREPRPRRAGQAARLLPTRTARPRSSYFVLAGSGLAWQDGDVHEVRPLDCVIHRPDEMEHTFVAGADGLEYLVFGTRHPTELGWLPRSRAIRLGWPWVEGRDDDPWDIEATVEPLAVGEPAPRPANIVNVDEVEHEVARGSGPTAPLATRERSMLAGLHWEKLDRGPPRLRSALPLRRRRRSSSSSTGTATLELWPPRRATSRRRRCAPATSSRVRRGRASRTPSAPARTA